MAEELIKHDVRGMISRGRHRFDVPDTPYGERVQNWILEHSVEHLYGPDVVDYAVDELVVLVLLRNGRPYIDQFVEHYLSLGAKHIVFLDNGSTDGSVEAMRKHDNVTVLRTSLPYKRYNVAMKQYCIRRFGRGRWTLTVDIDELFEYPYSDVVSLKNLLGYLNDNSYTAVVSYMLDMFPETLLSEENTVEGESLRETHRFYDLSDIRSQNYHDIGDIGNTLSNEEIVILKGGIQKRVFQVSPLLIKHPLVFLDDEIRPMDLSDHWAGNARIADFTGVLLHYKLSANLYGLVRREVEERRYISRHGKYDKYAKVLEEVPGVLIKSDTSRELESVNDLVGSRIVSLSKQYMSFVEDEERKTERYSEERRADRFSDAFFTARAEVAAYSKSIGDLEKRLKEQRRVARRVQQRRRARQIGMESEQHHLALRAQSAEEQIRAIQSSTAWKVVMLIGGVKARVGRVLGRLHNRLLGPK
jgi:glycosyltransferase involved in cell wall biosynthesis